MKRMTNEQQELLNQEYIKNPNWSSSQIHEFAGRLGLSKTKVYKWNWDRRNKTRRENQAPNTTFDEGEPVDEDPLQDAQSSDDQFH